MEVPHYIMEWLSYMVMILLFSLIAKVWWDET